MRLTDDRPTGYGKFSFLEFFSLACSFGPFGYRAALDIRTH